MVKLMHEITLYFLLGALSEECFVIYSKTNDITFLSIPMICVLIARMIFDYKRMCELTEYQESCGNERN